MANYTPHNKAEQDHTFLRAYLELEGCSCYIESFPGESATL